MLTVLVPRDGPLAGVPPAAGAPAEAAGEVCRVDEDGDGVGGLALVAGLVEGHQGHVVAGVDGLREGELVGGPLAGRVRPPEGLEDLKSSVGVF